MKSLFQSLSISSLRGSSRAPEERFTLDYLKELYGVLSKNPVITRKNEADVRETMREMTELLVWGDQHDSPQFFDYFLEKNLLTYLMNTLLSANTPNSVQVQILQTLAILIENIRSQNAVFYMLSNNHINAINKLI